jgi:anti-sigma-K factor RskA
MNSPIDSGNEDLRYAEYVLGVLDADARAEVAQQVRDNATAAAALALWQRYLTPLSEDIAVVEPPAYIWARIQHDLNLRTVATAPLPAIPVRDGLWNSLPLWRWLGMGAGAIAAACLVVMFNARSPTVSTVPAPTVATSPSTPKSVATGYMVSSIQQDNGVAGWTATMDLQNAQMVIVPATPRAIASDRSTELWLIGPNGKPLPLGVIGRDKPTTVKLSPSLLALLSPKAVLAVSIEPLGGSPTGLPTGAVIAKGAISGA